MAKQLSLDMFQKCGDTFKPIERSKFGIDPSIICDRVKVCCPKLPDWSETLQKVGGFDLEGTSNVVKVTPLPKIVYAITGDQGHRPFMGAVRDRTWAVKYQRAIAGNLYDTDRLERWRFRQGIPASKRLILHQESNDKDLERFFQKTYHPNFFAILRASPNLTCISPGYSVYDDGSMCRHHQLLNLKRSIDFFVRASDNGIPCIPCLGWATQEDLERIADWLNDHPKIQYVATNCQTLKPEQFPKLRYDMAFLERLSRPLHWVLFGGREVTSYLNIQGFSRRITLITASPIQRARAGRAVDQMFYSQNQVDLFLYNRAATQACFNTGTHKSPHLQ